MTQQQLPDDSGRAPAERTRGSRGGGSIGLVLLIALMLVGAAGGILALDPLTPAQIVYNIRTGR